MEVAAEREKFNQVIVVFHSPQDGILTRWAVSSKPSHRRKVNPCPHLSIQGGAAEWPSVAALHYCHPKKGPINRS